MSKLYFVRHGESEWNVADKICGRTDIPLTKRGHEQAVETGKQIVAEGIKADEILGLQICSIHNLSFYLWLVREARKHILEGDFVTWKESTIKKVTRRL